MIKKSLLLVVTLIFALNICYTYDKNMQENDKILKGAIEFHGHLGPYLVLGLKAGLYANEVLGKDPMRMKAIIYTLPNPPQSCFVDGVQFSTGCTYGKRNISIKQDEGVSVIFTKNNMKLTLILKKKIIEEINSLPKDKEEEWEKLALDLYNRKINEIFNIKN